MAIVKHEYEAPSVAGFSEAEDLDLSGAARTYPGDPNISPGDSSDPRGAIGTGSPSKGKAGK